LNSDGGFEYTPDPDFSGQDSFIYFATDGKANSAHRFVYINISAVNDAPLAIQDAYQVTIKRAIIDSITKTIRTIEIGIWRVIKTTIFIQMQCPIIHISS
jgi:hypothetical protein